MKAQRLVRIMPYWRPSASMRRVAAIARTAIKLALPALVRRLGFAWSIRSRVEIRPACPVHVAAAARSACRTVAAPSCRRARRRSRNRASGSPHAGHGEACAPARPAIARPPSPTIESSFARNRIMPLQQRLPAANPLGPDECRQYEAAGVTPLVTYASIACTCSGRIPHVARTCRAPRPHVAPDGLVSRTRPPTPSLLADSNSAFYGRPRQAAVFFVESCRFALAPPPAAAAQRPPWPSSISPTPR